MRYLGNPRRDRGALFPLSRYIGARTHADARRDRESTSVCMKEREREREREGRERWRQRRSTRSTLRVTGSPLHPDTFRLSLPLFHRSPLFLLLERLPPFFHVLYEHALHCSPNHVALALTRLRRNLAAINRDRRSPIEVSRRDAESILLPARDEKRHGSNRRASTAVLPRGEHLRGIQKGKTG